MIEEHPCCDKPELCSTCNALNNLLVEAIRSFLGLDPIKHKNTSKHGSKKCTGVLKNL